jgi:hypothetical protein
MVLISYSTLDDYVYRLLPIRVGCKVKEGTSLIEYRALIDLIRRVGIESGERITWFIITYLALASQDSRFVVFRLGSRMAARDKGIGTHTRPPPAAIQSANALLCT